MTITEEIGSAILTMADPTKASHAQRFFKTEKGEYGEGDKFLGLTMPEERQIAKQFAAQATLKDIQKLLESPWHEFRMVGLLIMTYQYPKLSETQKHAYYQFYLKNTHRINNWDLVDVTTPRIVGDWLLHHPEQRAVLNKLVNSKNLWERRIAVLATNPLIKTSQFEEILKLSAMLLTDKHDLMHKAAGWMLREVGKKNKTTLVSFLDEHATKMPRTMLRYALEKFPEKTRKMYLAKKS